MKKKVERIVAVSLAVLGYAAPIGLGVWRVMRRKKHPSISMALVKSSESAQQDAAGVETVPLPQRDEQKLESLSLSTPGDAPLDRLARRAAWEQREKHQPQHSNLKKSEPSKSQASCKPDGESVAAQLHNQSLDSDRLEGWSSPAPERLPIPTYAPAIMAFGIIVFAMGLATIWYVCVAGCIVFAVAAWRWIGELQGE